MCLSRVVALVPFMAAGCMGDVDGSLPFAPASFNAAPDPALFGPYPVGVRTMTFVDDTREQPDSDEPRSLVTEIWYPAVEDVRDGPFSKYVLYDELPADLQEGLAPEDLGELETRATRDAEPRRDGTRFPVVVFSHGKGGIRQQSTFFTVFLASHGYVVAAPDHQGDTVVDLLRELRTSGDIEPAPVVEALVDRPLDVSFVLDSLAALGDDDPLGRILDLDHAGVAGHSFGALTSFIVVTRDDRIDAVVGQAPTSQDVVHLQSTMLLSELDVPSLVQSGSMDRTLPEETNAKPLYAELGGEKAWLSLTTAGHFTFSDLCVLDVEAIDAAFEIDASNVLTDGCGVDNVPPGDAFPAMRTSAIGWFNRWLRGSVPTEKYLSQSSLDRHGPDLGSFARE
jgi:predicted dienelactone hydrolase